MPAATSPHITLESPVDQTTAPPPRELRLRRRVLEAKLLAHRCGWLDLNARVVEALARELQQLLRTLGDPSAGAELPYRNPEARDGAAAKRDARRSQGGIGGSGSVSVTDAARADASPAAGTAVTMIETYRRAS